MTTAPGGVSRVIKASETRTLSDALAMKQEAERMLAGAQSRTGEAEAQARRKGEEEGLRVGRELALKSLSLIISNLQARFQAYETDLSGVVVSAVQRILADMPEEALVRGAVKRALADLADQTSITLLVAPEERARTLAALEADPQVKQAIREVRGDPALAPGDMILDTSHGRYNIGLRSQLQRLADGLRPGAGA